jgi:cytidylate kinase
MARDWAERGRALAGLTVTIDGPAGAGKSSVARRLAARLGYVNLDTGAMYRAVALAALEAGLVDADGDRLARLAAEAGIALTPNGVQLGGRDVSREIRTPAVDAVVSRVSAHPELRAHLLVRQRELAREGGVVIEGRDAGTVIAPDAAAKFFLTASLAERARRRALDLRRRGVPADAAALATSLERRDREDQERAAAPLRPAPDATVVDTTGLTEDEVVERLEREVRRRQAAIGVRT